MAAFWIDTDRVARTAQVHRVACRLCQDGAGHDDARRIGHQWLSAPTYDDARRIASATRYPVADCRECRPRDRSRLRVFAR